MRIDLEYPFSEMYDVGYLISKKSDGGRRHVYFAKDGVIITGTSYARYLVGVSEGKVVSPEFEIDHVNRDKTDDRLENLQKLTIEEHRAKNSSESKTGRKMVLLTCEKCATGFEREARNVYTPSKIGKPVYCSRACFYSK